MTDGRHPRRAGLALLLGLVTACGPAGAGASPREGPRPAEQVDAVHSETLARHHSDVGPVLVDGDGRSLYMFTADVPGTSACGSECLHQWPAFDGAAAHAGAGVDAKLISTLTRPDGTEQIAYHEHPLYYFSGDERVGDIEGQGATAFGGSWFLLRPDGTPVRP